MGDSFNRCNETAEAQNIREHLQMIVENEYLLKKYTIFKPVKYIIAFMDDCDDEDVDPAIKQIKKLKVMAVKEKEKRKMDMQMIS